ncbi:hypothetical protein R1sor_002997 [Riccia sorocarpa]|uniref:Uncharacterized protein n=1 Tax=Riccia sorocarpa TaxID=122646 RepID=A0ABD3H0B3_9MARC
MDLYDVELYLFQWSSVVSDPRRHLLLRREHVHYPGQHPTIGLRVATPAIGIRVATPAIGLRVAIPAIGLRVAIPAIGLRVTTPAIGLGIATPAIGLKVATPAIGLRVATPTIGLRIRVSTVGLHTCGPLLGIDVGVYCHSSVVNTELDSGAMSTPDSNSTGIQDDVSGDSDVSQQMRGKKGGRGRGRTGKILAQ